MEERVGRVSTYWGRLRNRGPPSEDGSKLELASWRVAKWTHFISSTHWIWGSLWMNLSEPTCFLLFEFWCALGCPCSTSETALAERHIFQSEANLEEIIQNFAYFLLLKGRNCFFISTNKTRQLDFQVFVGLLFNCCWFRARRKFHFSKSTFPFRSIGQDLRRHLKNISRTSLCLS